MGCSSSKVQQHGGDIGAPRPIEEPPAGTGDTAVKEIQKKVRELHLSMCVEENAVPNSVREKLVQEVRADSCRTVESGIQSTPLASTVGSIASSCRSQLDYANPDQTIIILDWDDTLCPSTHLRQLSSHAPGGRFSLNVDHKIRSELNMLAAQVRPLLSALMGMGKVVIVTNAKRPWVTISCNSFLPSLRELLSKMPVIYALELVKYTSTPPNLLTKTKAAAMKAAVSEFYSRYPKQSWKNIISIGDALFEHNAIRQVVGERRAVGPAKETCRTKTIKLLESPTIGGLIVQLSLIKSWMARIVHQDGDIDIDLGASEDAVNSWVEHFAALPVSGKVTSATSVTSVGSGARRPP